jgi:hypothetical protein
LTCSQNEKKSDQYLLLLEDEDKTHYIYINNSLKLVRDQLTKHEHITLSVKDFSIIQTM